MKRRMQILSSVLESVVCIGMFFTVFFFYRIQAESMNGSGPASAVHCTTKMKNYHQISYVFHQKWHFFFKSAIFSLWCTKKNSILGHSLSRVIEDLYKQSKIFIFTQHRITCLQHLNCQNDHLCKTTINLSFKAPGWISYILLEFRDKIWAQL